MKLKRPLTPEEATNEQATNMTVESLLVKYIDNELKWVDNLNKLRLKENPDYTIEYLKVFIEDLLEQLGVHTDQDDFVYGETRKRFYSQHALIRICELSKFSRLGCFTGSEIVFLVRHFMSDNTRELMIYQQGVSDAEYQSRRARRGCPSRCGATAPSSMASAAMI